MMADTPADRGRWIEPALATITTALVLISQSWDEPTLRLIDLVLGVSAGLSAIFPRTAAVIGGTALASFLFFPAEDVSIAGLALFINIFAAFRMALPERIPITVVLTAVVYFTLVSHAYSDTDLEAGAVFVLILLLAVAVAAGHGWQQATRRLTIERVGAEERVATLRVDLARDLHDTVAQTLSHAAMRAHMASLHPDATPELAEELNLIAADCSSSSQDLRKLLQTLREHDTAEGPVGGPLADIESLRSVIEDQAGRLRAKGLVPITSVDIGPISAARATTLSKVAVEATSNMIKHARPGSECHLTIRESDDAITADFMNPTNGRSVSRQGLGLVGIEERVALLGGKVTVDRGGSKWRLRVTLPHGYERRAGEITGSESRRP